MFLGWVPIGVSCLLFSIMMLLFPRMLPRAAARKKEQPQSKNEQLLTGKFEHNNITNYT